MDAFKPVPLTFVFTLSTFACFAGGCGDAPSEGTESATDSTAGPGSETVGTSDGESTPDSGMTEGTTEEATDGEMSDSETTDGESETDGETTEGESETDDPVAGPVLYMNDRTHSPITTDIADHLRSVAASNTDRDDSVFAKIGASSTVSKQFMHCFSGDHVDLADHSALQPTVEWFKTLVSDTEDAYTRESLSATVGWAAFHALDGDPSPLQQEVDAIEPRYAVILYGTNDIGYNNLYGYTNNMLDIVDTLLAQGVIPVLSSIMPRDDNPTADAKVPRYNLAVRAVAQARRIPFIDYHRELIVLPDHGLGGDDLHPSVYSPMGSSRSCVFTPEGLQYGYSIRNLLTIQALDRLRQTISELAPELDEQATRLDGTGTRVSPYQVPGLPFAHHGNTNGGESSFDMYDGCTADQDESGPELLYRFELDAPKTVRIHVFDREGVDIDLHLLDASATTQGCIQRDDREIVHELAAGTYFVVLDTFVNDGVPAAGEYLMIMLEES